MVMKYKGLKMTIGDLEAGPGGGNPENLSDEEFAGLARD